MNELENTVPSVPNSTDTRPPAEAGLAPDEAPKTSTPQKKDPWWLMPILVVVGLILWRLLTANAFEPVKLSVDALRIVSNGYNAKVLLNITLSNTSKKRIDFDRAHLCNTLLPSKYTREYPLAISGLNPGESVSYEMSCEASDTTNHRFPNAAKSYAAKVKLRLYKGGWSEKDAVTSWMFCN